MSWISKLFEQEMCKCPPPHFTQANGTCSVCARQLPQGAELWKPELAPRVENQTQAIARSFNPLAEAIDDVLQDFREGCGPEGQNVVAAVEAVLEEHGYELVTAEAPKTEARVPEGCNMSIEGFAWGRCAAKACNYPTCAKKVPTNAGR